MRLIVLVLAGLFSFQLAGQSNLNLELVANVPTASSANDIWGFVDQDGIEYAIVGTQDNTLVFSLADPSAPELLLTIDGTNTVWRDMKSWGNYVYSVTDNTSDGLTILDMSDPTVSIPVTTYFPTFEFDSVELTIVNAHNLYVDEKGILCMTGCNVLDGAPVLLDVAANPLEPEVVGYVPGEYAHDIYIKDDILYASEIFIGELNVYDITDKMQPIQLGGAETSFAFTHNAWLSEDGTHIFTTDERNNAFVDAYDVTDFNDIQRVSSVRPRREGGGVVPHNTHYHDGYLVTSWYGDGVIVVDANKPDNLVIVGRYDTNTNESQGFVGCWGAYPFLPSGLILASDRQSGLYVLRPNYPRASYFEGCVVDGITGAPLSDVEVRIPITEVFTTTDAIGEFRSGHSEAGMQAVIFERNGYRQVQMSVDLVEGEVTELKVEMFPAELLNMTVSVRDAATGEMIPDAQVEIDGPGYDFDFVTDDTGIFSTSIFVGDYTFTIGAWGYLHKVEQILVQNNEVVIEIQRGYQDDFYFDLGWDLPEDTSWERLGDDDIETDLGTQFYQNFDPMSDEGIRTPAMDLSELSFPAISFSARLFTSGAKLIPTFIIGGERIAALEIDDTDFNWQRYELHVFNAVPEGTDLSEVFFEFDLELTNGLDLFDVDAFLVQEGQPSSTVDVSATALTLAPNPTSDQLTISSHNGAEWASVEIRDVEGKLISRIESNNASEQKVDVSDLEGGVYLLSAQAKSGAVYTRKFVKD